MDFESLITLRGEEEISKVLGVSVRTLDNLRRGYVALTVDDFFELARNYPRHNLTATVKTVGERRFLAGRNRKKRNQNSRRGIALRGKRIAMEDVKESYLPAPAGWVQISKDDKGNVWSDPVVGILVKSDGNCYPLVAQSNGEGTDLQEFAFGGGEFARGVATSDQALSILGSAAS